MVIEHLEEGTIGFGCSSVQCCEEYESMKESRSAQQWFSEESPCTGPPNLEQRRPSDTGGRQGMWSSMGLEASYRLGRARRHHPSSSSRWRRWIWFALSRASYPWSKQAYSGKRSWNFQRPQCGFRRGLDRLRFGIPKRTVIVPHLWIYSIVIFLQSPFYLCYFSWFPDKFTFKY